MQIQKEIESEKQSSQSSVINLPCTGISFSVPQAVSKNIPHEIAEELLHRAGNVKYFYSVFHI